MPGLLPSDPKQKLRLQRVLLAQAGAVIYTAFCLAAYALGYFQGTATELAVLLIGGWVVILCFPLMIITGVNLLFADPSMTLLQMTATTVLVLIGVYFFHPVKLVLLTFYQMVLVFGAFRLRPGGFIFITALVVLGYAAAIMALMVRHPAHVDMQAELLQWLGFAVVTAIIAYLGSDISALRQAHSQKNKELSRALDRISELAITDELTGIYNRRHILDVLGRQKAMADRGGYTFVVGFVDLDHFKLVNDRFGHSVGDLVLQKFAELTVRAVREVDYVARFGGEEFIVVLSKTGLSEARKAAERVRRGIEKFSFGDVDPGLQVTASIGMAQYRPDERIEDLLSRADDALYRAKEAGRNRVVAEDELLV